MSRYIIRKPEFLNGAENARFLPSTAAVIGILLLIFIAWLVTAVLVMIAILSSAGRQFRYDDLYSVIYSQTALIILLLSEGLLMVFTIIYIRWIEKRPLRTIGFVKRRFALKFLLGFGVGFVLICLNVLSVFIAEPVTFTGIKPAAFAFLITFIALGAGEEVLFRGFMMSALMRRGGAMWALAISTIVFGLFHLSNGYNALQFLSVLLLGAVLGVYMLREGSIWGAIGLHAAWDFFLLSLVKVPIGPYDAGYSFFDAAIPESEGLIFTLIPFLALFSLLALLLFAGENRLVVRKSGEQMLYEKAFRIVKKEVKEWGQLYYLRRIVELAQGAQGKTAALLFQALNCGVPAEYIRQEFGDGMFFAADALAVRYGETPESYWSRVSGYPAAMSVKNAERRLEEIKRPKNIAVNPYMPPPGLTLCPLLRWGITNEYCRHIMQAVDGAVTAEGYIAALDHDICRACPARHAARYDTAPPPRPTDESRRSFQGDIGPR